MSSDLQRLELRSTAPKSATKRVADAFLRPDSRTKKRKAIEMMDYNSNNNNSNKNYYIYMCINI